MKIIRFLDPLGKPRWGTDFKDGTAVPLAGSLYGSFRKEGYRLPVRRLLAPVVPKAIFGIGLNYRAHAEETGRPLPERPLVFMKNPAALLDPGSPIVIPGICADRPQVDYEGELAVVIGREARNVSLREALDHVLGYTAANDVSARWWQREGSGGQFVRGKSFDTFCPLGPVLVTADEISDPQSLRLKTTLNGQVVQDAGTEDMIFSVAELVAELSRGMTLLPGTVILTGTPAGVGAARKPPRFLQAGDLVQVEIEGIGALENPVRQERPE